MKFIICGIDYIVLCVIDMVVMMCFYCDVVGCYVEKE